MTVNVWAFVTSLTALGTMEMLPSTNTLVAGPEPPGPEIPAVLRVMVTVFTVKVAEALATNVPATSELMITVH